MLCLQLAISLYSLEGINFLRFHDVNLEINCQSLGELEIGIQILVYIREKQNRIKLNVSFWKFFFLDMIIFVRN